MTYKIDLHSHSIISHDGGITARQYEDALTAGVLDCIAITDHNETRFARMLHKKLGDKIIVGEEIKTKDGEIIGLFLTKTIEPGMSARDTIAAIHSQGGLVSVPHPFETWRSGLQMEVLEELRDEIDMLEVWNARARWRGKPMQTEAFATTYRIAMAASSDAHHYKGLGFSCSEVDAMPTGASLKQLLLRGSLIRTHAPLYTLLAPAINKIKNKLILPKMYE